MILVDMTGRDDGARVHVPPCAKRTWCILHVGHDGPCEEKPREPYEPADYGPHRKPYQPKRKGGE